MANKKDAWQQMIESVLDTMELSKDYGMTDEQIKDCVWHIYNQDWIYNEFYEDVEEELISWTRENGIEMI